MEAKLRAVPGCSEFIRDNLVQSPPLADGKLRYPTQKEMKSEWLPFQRRLARQKSGIVILLGKIVADFFREMRDIRMVTQSSTAGRFLKWTGVDDKHGLLVLAVAHPSYIGVYARKHISEYAEIIFQAILGYMKEDFV